MEQGRNWGRPTRCLKRTSTELKITEDGAINFVAHLQRELRSREVVLLECQYTQQQANSRALIGQVQRLEEHVDELLQSRLAEPENINQK